MLGASLYFLFDIFHSDSTFSPVKKSKKSEFNEVAQPLTSPHQINIKNIEQNYRILLTKKIESIIYINIIIPEIILAISLVLLFSFFNIPLGFSTLIVAYTTAFLGYSFPFLSQKWKEFDKTLITAAKDLGATTKIIWKTLIFPMFQDTFYSIAFLVFIITFDDYVFAYFCGNSETLTLPLYILLSLRMGISPELKVLILLFFIFSLLFGIAYLSRINSKRNPCDD